MGQGDGIEGLCMAKTLSHLHVGLSVNGHRLHCDHLRGLPGRALQNFGASIVQAFALPMPYDDYFDISKPTPTLILRRLLSHPS